MKSKVKLHYLYIPLFVPISFCLIF